MNSPICGLIFLRVLRPETIEHTLRIDKLFLLAGQVMGGNKPVCGTADEEIPVRPEGYNPEIVVQQITAGAGDVTVQAALGEVEFSFAIAALKRVAVRGCKRLVAAYIQCLCCFLNLHD